LHRQPCRRQRPGGGLAEEGRHQQREAVATHGPRGPVGVGQRWREQAVYDGCERYGDRPHEPVRLLPTGGTQGGRVGACVAGEGRPRSSQNQRGTSLMSQNILWRAAGLALALAAGAPAADPPAPAKDAAANKRLLYVVKHRAAKDVAAVLGAYFKGAAEFRTVP